MKRPAVLIVGAIAGALLVAGIGASAHTVSFLTRSSQQGATIGDESSGARTEPSESPEATETPEAADTDTDENDDAQGDENDQGAAAAGAGEHETGDHEGSGTGTSGGGGHGD